MCDFLKVLNTDYQIDAIRLSQISMLKNSSRVDHAFKQTLVDVDVFDVKAALENLASLDFKKIVPVFCWKEEVKCEGFESLQSKIQSNFRQVFEGAYNLGFRFAILGCDCDSLLQKILSPRYKFLQDVSSASQFVIQIFAEMHKIFDTAGAAIVVEELCPGGFDPTDGIELATCLQEVGASFLIVSSGTEDFMPLKRRRQTKLSTENVAQKEFVELAGALWLKDQVKAPLILQVERVLDAAKKKTVADLGLKGVLINLEES